MNSTITVTITITIFTFFGHLAASLQIGQDFLNLECVLHRIFSGSVAITSFASSCLTSSFNIIGFSHLQNLPLTF
jgi:hypothetical protein